MGFLRQGRQPPSTIPLYTGLQIQTSSNAVPITIQYGTNKIAPNAIWSGVFYAVPQYQKQGGKGGGGRQLQGYTYYTSFIMGVCEGPINYFSATLLNQSFLWGGALEFSNRRTAPHRKRLGDTFRQIFPGRLSGIMDWHTSPLQIILLARHQAYRNSHSSYKA